jgi:hypothetical protein
LQSGCSVSKKNISEEEIDFIEGELKILDFNNQFTRFEIPRSKNIINLKNDIHIRLKSDHTNNLYSILAPVTAVDVSDRKLIPLDLIKKYKMSHFDNLSKNLNENKNLEKNMVSNEKNFLESYYSEQHIFEKNTLDMYFAFSINDWIDYATYTEKKDKKIKFEKRIEGKNITIVFSTIDNDPLYGIGTVTDEFSDKIGAVIVTKFYEGKNMPEGEKIFYEKLLHSSSYKVPNSNYSVFSECQKILNNYILVFTIIRN